MSFLSWAPRRVWLSGQERIAFGDPQWALELADALLTLDPQVERHGRSPVAHRVGLS